MHPLEPLLKDAISRQRAAGSRHSKPPTNSEERWEGDRVGRRSFKPSTCLPWGKMSLITKTTQVEIPAHGDRHGRPPMARYCVMLVHFETRGRWIATFETTYQLRRAVGGRPCRSPFIQTLDMPALGKDVAITKTTQVEIPAHGDRHGRPP